MQPKRFFWGLFLISLGVVFILNQFGNFNSFLGKTYYLWPLILILIGLSYLKFPLIIRLISAAMGGVLAALVIASLGNMNFYDISHSNFLMRHVHLNYRSNDDDDSNTIKHPDLTIDYDSTVSTATLNFNGGDGSFKLFDTTSKLMEVVPNTMLKVGELTSGKDTSKKSMDIRFDTGENENLFKNGNAKTVDVKLNKKPVWELNAEIGAGEFNFDLSQFNVNNVTVNAGAAHVILKIGSIADSVDIQIETGVTKVDIYVPKSSFCKINCETALSHKNFNGFSKYSQDDEEYITTNRKDNKKIINIDLKGGVSKYNVIRY